MTTVYAGIVFLAMYALGIVAWVVFAWLGLRWARLPKHWSAVMPLAVMYFSFNYGSLAIMLLLIDSETPVLAAVANIARGIITLCLPAILFRRAFATNWKQTFKIWFVTLVGPSIASVIVALVVTTYLMETFAISANSMAPTLLGKHVLRECPDCGEAAYHSVVSREPRGGKIDIICDRFHTNQVRYRVDKQELGDRLIANKWLKPRRWDLVVFKNQYDEQSYVKRLVGLPGDTLQIKDGSVWINGDKQDPPLPIYYQSEMEHVNVWGAEPITLQANEYFVLGDFSKASLDSRLWIKSIGSRPAYAISKEQIFAVGTHIYWPPSRCKILR